MAENLADLVAAFEARAAELAKELAGTREKIAPAREKLERTDGERQEAGGQLAKLRSQTHAFTDPNERNAFLARQTALQNKVGLFDEQAGEQRRELERLEARADELVLQIESHKSLFLVRLTEIARQIGDGAVRWLFVKRALAECPRLEIAPEKFSEPASQSAIGRALGDLRDLQSGADQQGGALFETIQALASEVAAASAQSIGRNRREEETNTALTAKREKHKVRIADLERPETEQELKSRKIRGWIGLGAGAVFIIAGAVVWYLTGAEQPVNVPVLIVLGAFALLSFGFAWWNSNLRRSISLSRNKRGLAATEQKIAASNAQEAAAEAAEAKQVEDFRVRLAEAGGNVPAPGSAPPLTDLSTAAAARLSGWIAAHPDYRFLAKG